MGKELERDSLKENFNLMFHGHCGLCGVLMNNAFPCHIDGIGSDKRQQVYPKDIDLIPVCLDCWHKKGVKSVDELREELKEEYEYFFKDHLLTRMGIITLNPFPDKFFFEKWWSLECENKKLEILLEPEE